MGFFMKQYIFYSQNKPLNCYMWNDVQRPIGVIQIIRDEYEKISQYDKLAQFLNANGYIVFGKYQDNKNNNLDKFEEIEIFKFLNQKFYLPVFLLTNHTKAQTAKNIINAFPKCGGACVIQNRNSMKEKIIGLFRNKFHNEMEICKKSPILIIDKTEKLPLINNELIYNLEVDYKHNRLHNLDIVLYQTNATNDDHEHIKNDVLKFFNRAKFK